MERKNRLFFIKPLNEQSPEKPGVHRFDFRAMNTVFEIMTTHPDAYYAHQAAHEAFVFLDHLEHDVSRFISNSDISRINMSPGHLTIISEETAQCLSAARVMEKETHGSFNIMIGHLVDQYQKGKNRGIQSLPSSVDHLELDMERFLAGIKNEDALIDLGGIAKGFALDKMADVLEDWDIHDFLIHGGQSTVYANGRFGEADGWPVSVTDPFSEPNTQAVYRLSGALSASGMDKGAHIINPRTMQPVDPDQATWAMAQNAAETDALSTAFMCMSQEAIHSYCAENPGTGALKYRKLKDRTEILYFGTWENTAG